MRLSGLAVVAAFVVAADQATKALVRSSLAVGEEVHALGPFSIHRVQNSGILGGHLQGSALPVAVVTTIALALLAVYICRRDRAQPLATIAFGLVLGGGLGNLIDRVRLGYVTDFIDRGSGGAFNLADLAIFLGLMTFLIASAIERRSPDGSVDPRPDASRRD